MINSRAKGAKIILLLTKILCSRLYYRNYRVSVKRSNEEMLENTMQKICRIILVKKSSSSLKWIKLIFQN